MRERSIGSGPCQLRGGVVDEVAGVVGHVGAGRPRRPRLRRSRMLPVGGALGRAAEDVDGVAHAPINGDLWRQRREIKAS